MNERKFFVHPKALVEDGVNIGASSRVWAFSHILSGAVIGNDCNICDHTFIEGKVQIGDRVTIKSGVYIWDGFVAEDDVFIGPSVAFTNDLRPRSKKYPDNYVVTRFLNGCSIGANATILPGITVGKWAMIGAGSVVTRDVKDYALSFGNPARFKGWACQCGERLVVSEKCDVRCECGLSYRVVGKRKEEMNLVQV